MNANNTRQRGDFQEYDDYEDVQEQPQEQTTTETIPKMDALATTKSTDFNIHTEHPATTPPARYSRPIKRDVMYSKQPQQTQTQNIKPLYISVTKLNDMIEAFHGRMFINAVVITSGRFVGQYTTQQDLIQTY